MGSLQDTEWDVVIAGTGIQQSLLALAISRSGLKVLHVDRNDHYGGAETALNLVDAIQWVRQTNTSDSDARLFRSASIATHDEHRLPRPRAYNLALAPDLIYTSSGLLQALVKTHVDAHLEFKAVGSWYVYQRRTPDDRAWSFAKVPESREAIFADPALAPKTKGALVRALRFINEYEHRTSDWKPDADRPLSDLLTTRFKLPLQLQGQLLALTLSSASTKSTSRELALGRIANHLRSFNTLGPGFNAVVPTFGGLSEVAQIACRASAVGGATYVLNCSVDDLSTCLAGDDDKRVQVKLGNGDIVTTRHVVGTLDQMPCAGIDTGSSIETIRISRSISIIDSPLTHLFARTSEGAPAPAASVVVVPSAAEMDSEFAGVSSPVHLIVHSSDTGECPTGQCVIYTSVAHEIQQGETILARAVANFLAGAGQEPMADILWSMNYEQVGRRQPGSLLQDKATPNAHIFPNLTVDPIFDESILGTVKQAWQNILGHDATDFLVIDDRTLLPREDET